MKKRLYRKNFIQKKDYVEKRPYRKKTKQESDYMGK